MKTCTVLTAGLVMGVATTAFAAPTPLLHYSFDGDYASDPDGFTAFNSGSLGSVADVGLAVRDGADPTRVARDLHSAPGVGVDGVGRALDQREIGSGSPVGFAYNAQNYTAGPVNGVEGLMSFTVTTWFKGPSGTGNIGDRKIIDAGAFTGGGGFTVQGNLRVDNQSLNGTDLLKRSPDEWVFLAVRFNYDAGTDTVTTHTYLASLTEPIGSPIHTGIYGPGHALNVGVTGASGEHFAVGGRQATGNSTARTFDGLIDELMVFGSKVDDSGFLSTEDIEAIRVGTIPEPGTLSLLGIGSVLALCRRSRRQA